MSKSQAVSWQTRPEKLLTFARKGRIQKRPASEVQSEDSRLSVVNGMFLEPVLITSRAHFLQSGASHAGGELASLPSQSNRQTDHTPHHSETDRLGPAVSPTGKTGTYERCARADRSQAKGAARRLRQRIGQGLPAEM